MHVLCMYRGTLFPSCSLLTFLVQSSHFFPFFSVILLVLFLLDSPSLIGSSFLRFFSSPLFCPYNHYLFPYPFFPCLLYPNFLFCFPLRGGLGQSPFHPAVILHWQPNSNKSKHTHAYCTLKRTHRYFALRNLYVLGALSKQDHPHTIQCDHMVCCLVIKRGNIRGEKCSALDFPLLQKLSEERGT